MRFFLGGDLQADIAVAFPLSYRAPDNSSRSARLLFSLSKRLQALSRKSEDTLPLAALRVPVAAASTYALTS